MKRDATIMVECVSGAYSKRNSHCWHYLVKWSNVAFLERRWGSSGTVAALHLHQRRVAEL